jgi:hypothetical protein
MVWLYILTLSPERYEFTLSLAHPGLITSEQLAAHGYLNIVGVSGMIPLFCGGTFV